MQNKIIHDREGQPTSLNSNFCQAKLGIKVRGGGGRLVDHPWGTC